MAAFAKSGFRSANYNSFRPHYPPSFYKILTDYVGKPKVGHTIDLGCGTGVATYPLLNISESVVGMDISPPMIDTANKLKAQRLEEMGVADSDRISFTVSAVEDFEAPPESFDLITAAECIHWFKDHDAFFAAAARQLKPGGTLAYWYYVDPVIVGFSGPRNDMGDVAIKDRAMQLYRKFAYEDPELLGLCWDNPGRTYLQNFLVEVDKHIPHALYKDVIVNKYVPNTSGEVKYSDRDLQLAKRSISLKDYTNYFSTFSAYHNYNEKTGKGEEAIEQFTKACEEELGWDRNTTTVDLEWYAGYTFMKKR